MPQKRKKVVDLITCVVKICYSAWCTLITKHYVLWNALTMNKALRVSKLFCTFRKVFIALQVAGKHVQKHLRGYTNSLVCKKLGVKAQSQAHACAQNTLSQLYQILQKARAGSSSIPVAHQKMLSWRHKAHCMNCLGSIQWLKIFWDKMLLKIS